MKIETVKQKFEPITVTLETQEEVDILRALAGKVSGTGKVRLFVDKLWDELRYEVCRGFDSDNYVTGNLEAVKK